MKRASTSEPLTADDVAERLSRAALRIETILVEIADTPGLREQVLASPYLVAGRLNSLRSELDRWGVEPLENLTRAEADEADDTVSGKVVSERTTGAPLHGAAQALGFPDQSTLDRLRR